eukprot:g1746.t1
MKKSGVCVVVGAGPGLGSSVAVKFAKEGFNIAAMCRKKESFDKGAAKALAGVSGSQSIFVQCDATIQSSVTSAFATVRDKLGPVDVLVYNCGGGGFGLTPLEIKPDDFLQSFKVSCLGALLCTQAVLPDMLKKTGTKKKGTILYSSATSAFRGGAKTAQFACGKHGLRALSQSVAKAYASSGVHACHVRLDCILDTPGYVARWPAMKAQDKMGCTDDIAETYFAIHQQSPLGWSNEIDIRPYTEGWTC